MPTRLTSVSQLNFEPQGAVFPSPTDWRDQLFYHLMIDRFDDGKDHPPYDRATTPKGRDRKLAGYFQGGTLAGITRQLDYIQRLGATALWISPPFKQRIDDRRSYHGYGVQDFLAIDPRFGTVEDLRTLVSEAHLRGIYVILDIVLNHTADVFRYKGKGPHSFNKQGKYEFDRWHTVSHEVRIGPDDAIWPVELQNPNCFTLRGAIGNFMSASEEEAIHGDFYSLKNLDLSNPVTMDAMIRAHKYWIAATDIDGFRIDTVKHMEPQALAVFCNAIHEYTRRIGKSHFLLFGEVMGEDHLLRRYVGSNTPVHGSAHPYPMLDACLDFPLHGVLEEVIKGAASPKKLRERYADFHSYYRNSAEAGRYYVTFLDDHDQSYRPHRRFLHGCDDMRVGILGVTCLLTHIGIPCLYYGTEQGFDGGGDSDVFVRACMFGGTWGAFDTSGHHFFSEHHPIYQTIARLARIRAAEPALRYGRQHFLETSADGKQFSFSDRAKSLLAYSRNLDSDELIICLNLGTDPCDRWVRLREKSAQGDSAMVDLLGEHPTMEVDGQRDTPAFRVQLPARASAIFKRHTRPAGSL